MSQITIIDYGMGNLRSVAKAIEHVAPAGTRVVVSGSPVDVRAADRVVFPGQGAAADCMSELRQRDLADVVLEVAADRPFLGICMGMQVLMAHSEENGGTECLGLFPGAVRRFGDMTDAEGLRLKIPQVGWNGLMPTRAHPLFDGIEAGTRFYFVHSYHVVPEDESLVAATTDYGIRYASALVQDNVFALQPHPEKSAAAGLRLLENFARWDGSA
ncbi:MAG: imidazole glycerol phosphate synthase subunit HisH [Halothiobacillaceae bacterium]